MSGEEPTFADFAAKRRFKGETIDLLIAEGYDDLDLLTHLTPERIAELVVVGLKSGEALRLELSVKSLRKACGLDVTVDTDENPFDGNNGDSNGKHSGSQGGSQGNNNGGPTPTDDPKVTTRTLAADKEVNAIVDEILADKGKLQGLKNVLSLVELRQKQCGQGPSVSTGQATGQSGSIPTASSRDQQGEQITSPTERPLLIGDFITSSYRYSVRDEEESIALNESSKIVVRKSKKPLIEDYDIELWSGANFRIILHLIRSKVSYPLLVQYLEYSSIIAEYFCIYEHPGIFDLDYEHRYRVAREGRAWNDICVIDEKKFLVFDHNRAKAPRKSKKSRRKGFKNQLDSDDNVICQNFNSRSGCDFDPCRYSHVCLQCRAKHPKFECSKQSKTHAR